MRVTVSSILLAAAAALSTACSSDGSGSVRSAGNPSAGNPSAGIPSVSESAAVDNWEEAEPVSGNVYATWKNLDPRSKAGAFSLVNESSEIGKKLRSGKATSSEIRVIGDAEMGRLIATLRKVGFFQHATQGLGLENIPTSSGSRGIVVVNQDGRSHGLMLTVGLGPGAVPQTYTECKQFILRVHETVPGYEVRVGTGEASERLFEAPPIRPRVGR